MKKVLSLILALVMCLSLCACGNKDTSSEKTPKEAVSDRAQSSVELTLTARKYKVARAKITTIEEVAENEFEFSGTYTAKDENYGEVKGTFEGTGIYDPETKDVDIIDIDID